MPVEISDEARRYIGRFGELTGVTPRDCLVDDDRRVFLLPAGRMATAIGPDGATVERAEERLGRRIDLVADADAPETFIANALAPAVVRGVTISEQGDRVAYVEVEADDRGIAIGDDGRNIDAARRLARRHHGIGDVELT
jgi:N utilization substance protein A